MEPDLIFFSPEVPLDVVGRAVREALGPAAAAAAAEEATVSSLQVSLFLTELDPSSSFRLPTR